MTPASENLRAPDGTVFWPRSGLHFETDEEQQLLLSNCEERRVVKLWERTWIFKQKLETLGEIGAYQLTQALNLPVLPWLACYDPTFLHQQAGLFVELWAVRQFGTLAHPDLINRDLVGRALTLEALDGFETPEWLGNEDQSDVRLFDLEYIGPHTNRPEDSGYTDEEMSRAIIVGAYNNAEKVGGVASFFAGLRDAVSLDLSQVIDFSGHPNGTELKSRYVNGLKARLAVVREFIALAE